MEIEYVLLLSDHYEWVVPFYKSSLSYPKRSTKSAPSLASHKRKGAVKLYSAQENSDQQFSAKYLMVRTI